MSVSAAPLDIDAAVAIALAADPTVRQIEAQAAAFEERAVAAAQLPDPKLKFGAGALPIDTFDLDQEPMTQLQVGFQQRFLPGDSLHLKGKQITSMAAARHEAVADQRLKTVRSLQEDYLEVLYQKKAGRIIAEARLLFDDLLEASRDYLATGRTRQQDVFRAELELSRLEDRAIRVAQAEEMARASLAVWLGDAAYRPLASEWPQLDGIKPLAELTADLALHPRLRALGKQVVASELGVDVARQQYKPGWMLDVTYGDRSGQNTNGGARADFINVMVSVDLPLFRGKRQDREVAASLKEIDAIVAERQDTYRQFQREAERQWAALLRLQERLELFSERLLPEAQANSEASLAAYQSGVGDFETLMRARITEYELHLDHARALVDRLIAQARLLYLSGGEA